MIETANDNANEADACREVIDMAVDAAFNRLVKHPYVQRHLAQYDAGDHLTVLAEMIANSAKRLTDYCVLVEEPWLLDVAGRV